MHRAQAPRGDPLPAPLVEVGVFAFAAAASLLLLRVGKFLAIPALLLGGLAVGPGGLGLLGDARVVHGANDVGLVLLLFYTSLFTHPRALHTGGRVALPLAAYDLILNFATAYWIGALFHWDLASRMLLAGVMATSSTGAILKILTDEGRLLRREGSVLIALLWIEDLVFIGYYLFLSGRLGVASSLFEWQTLLSLLLFVSYLALLYFLRETVWSVPQREILIPLVTGLGVLGAYLGNLGGLPFVASAFATGLILAGSRGARFVQTEAPYLREVAASIFFLSFGALLDPHATWRILPLAAAALVGILLTELAFLPQVARLLGLGAPEANVLGASLLARGGKSASFARLGSDTGAAQHSVQVESISGVLTILLTPLAPLLVRLILWLRRFEPRGLPARASRDIMSTVARRVLTPGEFAQRNPVRWTDRVVLVEWILLPFLLVLLATLVPFPWRWAPALFALATSVPAYRNVRRYFGFIPGTPGTTYASRGRSLPRLDRYLPQILLAPFLLALALTVASPWAEPAFPGLALATLAFLFALPYVVHPRTRAPSLRRALPVGTHRA